MNTFFDIKNYLPNALTKQQKKYISTQSSVDSFIINNESLNYVIDKLNYNISNILIKKKYLTNSDNINRSGSYGQYKNEVDALLILYRKKYFPLLLSINPNPNDRFIIINYCGELLNKDNLPENWKEQLLNIIKTLKLCNIYHNDMWINNFLVRDNELVLIDFGWASLSKSQYPYLNITEDDVNMYDDIFKLLNDTYHSKKNQQQRKKDNFQFINKNKNNHFLKINRNRNRNRNYFF